MGVGQEVVKRSDTEGKDRLVQQNLGFHRAAREAFGLPEGEGVTPSTFESVSSSQPEMPFPHMSKDTTRAMSQLMEHSGQIDLLTRMDHRLVDMSHPSLEQIQQQHAELEARPSAPPSPSRAMKEGRVGSSLRPQRVSMPPPQFSFGSFGSEQTTTTTAGTISDPLATLGPPAPMDGATLAAPPRPTIASASSGGSGASSMPPPTTAAPDGPFQPPLNVLVVDDDALTRKLMSRMLTRNGCNVETAENGQAALELATSARNPFTFKPSASTPGTAEKPRKVQTPYAHEEGTRYDLIFLDNQMPVLSGVEMVKKLRGMGRRDYVVGVTGNALKEDQEEYMDAGVDT